MELYIDSKRIYEGKILSVRVDTVEISKNGRHAKREVIEHGSAVAVLPIDGDGNLLLVKQFRYPVQAELIEIPAGLMEKGEEPLAAAQRELREETGYSAAKWTVLPPIFSTPGFSDEKLFMFIAEDLTWMPLSQDEDEDISLVRRSQADAKKMLTSTDVQDAKTIAALAVYFATRA